MSQAANVATIIGAAVASIGLVAVLYQLRHLRAGNFVIGWNLIKTELQKDEARIGRAICRQLNCTNKNHRLLEQLSDEKGWEQIVRVLADDFSQDSEFNKLQTSAPLDQAKDLSRYVSHACDAFDLAAIVAWHSHIPGLWNTVVAEWQDGIISTWEAGAPFLAERWKRDRAELFECFSALYAAALSLERGGADYIHTTAGEEG